MAAHRFNRLLPEGIVEATTRERDALLAAIAASFRAALAHPEAPDFLEALRQLKRLVRVR
jgi:hypothetical protein